MEKENAKLKRENDGLKRKIERIQLYIPEAKKLLISRALPAELVHEIFASLPLENAFDLLAKMPNGLLARNVRKILKSIEMAMKANKWNSAQCGPKIAISEGGLVLKHSGPDFTWNSVRAQSPIPKFSLNTKNPSIAYFEVEIVAKNPYWGCIYIGFCTQQFPLEGNVVGNVQNSIGIYYKGIIWIDGTSINLGNEFGNFEVGNVIGIGIAHFPANLTRKCFATCNGQLLGKADLPIKFANLELFPAVSMYLQNDLIRANFGANKWKYNPIPEQFAN